MAGPLAGITVLDLGRYIACPFCGLILADLGAEVIRIERPGGADDRHIGLLSPSGDNFGFISQNRNKKGISLNFERNEKARKILFELVKDSDVLIQNFSTSAARSMGITYENLKRVNPGIIFADISGFGPEGPYAERLGYDYVAKALSGVMSVSGFPGGTPVREQTFQVDYGTGMLAAIGVLAALYHRKENGQGQKVEAILLQTAVTYMASILAEYETGGKLRQQTGNRSPWVGPCDSYKTKDGRWVMLALYPSSIWRRFCKFLGREDLLNDPRFQTEQARWDYHEIIDPVVRDWVASHTVEELMAAADKIPIPLGLCQRQDEVANDPQVKALDMLIKVPAPDGSGDVLVTGIPLRMSETPLKVERSYPAVGQHNEEIYGGMLGLSHTELTKLKEEGVI